MKKISLYFCCITAISLLFSNCTTDSEKTNKDYLIGNWQDLSETVYLKKDSLFKDSLWHYFVKDSDHQYDESMESFMLLQPYVNDSNYREVELQLMEYFDSCDTDFCNQIIYASHNEFEFTIDSIFKSTFKNEEVEYSRRYSYTLDEDSIYVFQVGLDGQIDSMGNQYLFSEDYDTLTIVDQWNPQTDTQILVRIEP